MASSARFHSGYQIGLESTAAVAFCAQSRQEMIKLKSIAQTPVARLFLGMMLVIASIVQAQPGLRSEVVKPLSAAQEALKSNQTEQALRLATEAAAVPALTEPEQQLVWRLQAVAALRLQQWDLAIQRLDGLLGLASVSTADRLPLQEMLVNASIQKKDAARTVRVARQYLQGGGQHAGVRTALLQSLSMLGEHQALVREMQAFIQQDQAQGRKTPETDLRLMGAACLQLKDEASYFAVLKQLLGLYPSKAYWADAVVRLTNLPHFNSRYELDGYRLLAETDNLEEAAEYTEMAALALKAGLPTEALRVLDKGHAQGVLGKGSEAAVHARLLLEARKKSQEDDTLLPQLEQAAKDGNGWVAVADAHASKLNWPAALMAYDKAFKAGGLRREAEVRLHHGMALFKAGQKAAAKAQWQAIQSDSTAMELASLWELLVR